MTAPKRVALIGCGTWGRNWLRVMLADPAANLVAVVDPDPSVREVVRQAAIAADRPVPPHLVSLDALLGGLGAPAAGPVFDGAVVASPIASHASTAAALLAAGRHVLVEKPLATRWRQAVALVRAAEARGLSLAVGHTFLYSAGAEGLRDVLASGVLGELRFLASERTNFGRFGPHYGPLWELASHDVALILWWADGRRQGPVQTVSCTLGPSRVQPEDFAQLTLSLTPPLEVFVWCSWRAPHKIRRTLAAGLEALAVYEETPTGPRLTTYPTQPAPAGADREEAVSPSGAYPVGLVQPLKPAPDGLDNLGLEYRDWLRAWPGGHGPRASARLGLEVVGVLEAAERSAARGGRPVRPPGRAGP